MNRPGPDPRRRSGRSNPGDGSANHSTAVVPRRDRTAPNSRPVGRSSLWDNDQNRAGAQPLKASWNPVPDGDSPSRRDTDRADRAREPGRDNPPPPSGRKVKRRSALGWFLHRYGWRAYALPVLVAATVVVIVQAFRPDAGTQVAGQQPGPAVGAPAAGDGSASTTVTVANPGPTTTVVTTTQVTASAEVPPPSLETSTALPTGPNPNGKFAESVKAGALPPGAEFLPEGSGSWHVVPGSGEPVGKGTQTYTYTVEVEDGIQAKAADKEFADRVDSVLADQRSWIAGGDITLQRIDSGEPDFRISLTSPMTLRDPGYCGYSIPLEASCYNRAVGRVLINDARWVRGAVSYDGDLGLYRVYAINHEVGHALGFGHQACADNGGLAPVMMQQSFSTSNTDLQLLNPEIIPDDGKECRANPYPYPRGAGG